jgi:hypothetical protein
VTFCRLRQAGVRQASLWVNAAALDRWNGGSAPVAKCHSQGLSGRDMPAGPIPEGTLPGPVRSQGQGRTMRDPELTARAKHAALRLEPCGNNGPRSSSQRSFSRPRCQVTEQLASWPHGVPSAADQPSAGA